MRKYALRAVGYSSAIMVLSLVSQTVLALPIGTDYFSSAGTGYSTYINGDYANTIERDSDAVISSNGNVATTGSNPSSFIDGRGELMLESFARSDLGTAELKASSEISNHNAGGNYFSSATSYAAFGDSFTHTTGSSQPFLFDNGETSTFSLNIDGFSNTSISGSNSVRSQAYLSLFILNSGSLHNVVSDSTGRVNCCDENNINTLDDNLIEFATFGLTAQSTDFFDYGGDYSSDSRSVDAILASGLFEYDFSPNGDFDWVLELVTVSNILPFGLPDGDHFAVANFANTIDVGYSAPTGVSTRSGSGSFDSSVAVSVPEPSRLALLSLGMLGLFYRKGKVKSS